MTSTQRTLQILAYLDRIVPAAFGLFLLYTTLTSISQTGRIPDVHEYFPYIGVVFGSAFLIKLAAQAISKKLFANMCSDLNLQDDFGTLSRTTGYCTSHVNLVEQPKKPLSTSIETTLDCTLPIQIEPRRFIPKLRQPFELHEPNINTGDKEFDDRFQVTGDEDFVLRLLTPEIRQKLSAYDEDIGSLHLKENSITHTLQFVATDATLVDKILDAQADILNTIRRKAKEQRAQKLVQEPASESAHNNAF